MTQPDADRQPKLRPRVVVHLAAASLLLLFALAIYARLLFTNQVLASGDILHYFYPYRDFAAAALRDGRIPFWNPYIFMGAPFLANPQAAVLYPLHWPLSWLPVTKQIYWSAALHTWLLGLGGYALLRWWGYGWAPALITGITLAGSGFVGGLMGHINQLNGVAWLPWFILVLEQGWPRENSTTEIAPLRPPRPRLLAATAVAGPLVALMLLAGHTQTFYINLFGAGVWAVLPLFARMTLRQPALALRAVAPMLAIYFGGLLLGLLLAAPQLLPTLELSSLGLRSGGLSYGEASSFSLKPLHLLWTLLPSYGLVDLSAVFGTLGYTEFVAYVGIIGLGLALMGAWRGRGRAHSFGLLFGLLGLFLAAGRWNPLYFIFYQFVPGFDLFRAPARWMMLYSFGMAVLASIGSGYAIRFGARLVRGERRGALVPATVVTVLLLVLSAELLLAARALPHTQTTAPQAVYDVRTAPAHLLTDPERALHPAAAGRFLSMSGLTFDPGDMADYRRIFNVQGINAANDKEGAQPTLDERAFEQLVIAQKSQEILAPNLPMLWRVPAVDGFDGGVLPLQRYIQAMALLIAPSALVPDGRLREQIDRMPPADLLTLFNAAYVITDKVRDLWYDDVYYDRQIGARLTSEMTSTVIDVPQPFEATHVHVIGFVDGAPLPPEAQAVAQIDLLRQGAVAATFTLTAGAAPGAHFADAVLGSPAAARAGAEIAYRDVNNGRQEYLARFALEGPLTPAALRITLLADALEADPDGRTSEVVIQAVTLVDARTGMFMALLPSDRGDFALVHSGDVKIYANQAVMPRATLVHDWQTVATPDEALAYLREQGGSAQTRPVVESGAALAIEPDPDKAESGTGATNAGDATNTVNADTVNADTVEAETAEADTVEIVAYAPERIEIRTRSAAPGLLILADSYYPGWRATVDGVPASVLAANYLFRGVPVPEGEHTVVLTFQANGWSQGVILALIGFGLIGVLLLGGLISRRRPAG